MFNIELSKITQEEFDRALQNHFIYQKGGKNGKKIMLQNRDFSGIKIMGSDLSFANFEGSDFSNLDGNDYGTYHRQLYEVNLSGANCSRVNFGTINIGKCLSLKDTILVDAIFDSRKLTDEQKGDAIFTEEKYKEFLEKQNEKAKKQEIIINKQTKDIKEKNETLKKTSEKQSKGMLDIFDELRFAFWKEEVLWLFFAGLIFIIIFGLAITIIASINPALANIVSVALFGSITLILLVLSWADKVDNLTEKKDGDKDSIWTIRRIGISIGKTLGVIFVGYIITSQIEKTIQTWSHIICSSHLKENCINIEKAELILIPTTLFLLSLLWFSVHQYGRAKKLRIEQQNKQAMIHFMQAIIANDGKGAHADRSFPQLAPFFANAIIHRPFSQDNYDPQLPIDEVKKIVGMAKLFSK